MKSKINEKEIAIQMRKDGFTQPEIVSKLCVSKASVSNWVKDIPVPDWYHDKVKSKRLCKLYDIHNSLEWKKKMREIGIKHRKQPIAIIKNDKYYTCNNCKQTLKSQYFGKRKNRSHSSWCLECMRNYHRVTHMMVIDKLGRICDCGCDKFDLLEIHHINCNGIEERKEISHRKMLKKIYNMPIEEALREYKILCKVCHIAVHVVIKHPDLIYKIVALTN